MSAHNDATLRRLANSVLWPGFLGTTAPDWLKNALDDGLAGAVYFGQNIDPDDADQPARLSRELRGIRSDVLIGIDEEGGNVTRLESARGSSLPSAAQLGALNDIEQTRATGAEIGARMRAAGGDIALSVVADVNTNPQNPVIGVRAFGDNAALVSQHVAALVSGVQSTGVTACVKHFPGHGDTITDSHYELPRLGLSWADISRDHLPPFRAAIAVGARAVMTAHIVVPELGEEPATLNPRILGLLRNEGFTGAIITDAMDMAAVRSRYGAGRGAVLALAAGVDLLCIGNPGPFGPKGGTTTDLDDYLEMHTAILDALDDGSLDITALERASAVVAGLHQQSQEAFGSFGSLGSLGSSAPSSALAAGREHIRADAAPPGFAQSLCRRTGTITPFGASLTLFDLRASASIAVAAESNFFGRCFAERFDVTTVELGPSLYASRAHEAAASLAHTTSDASDSASLDSATLDGSSAVELAEAKKAEAVAFRVAAARRAVALEEAFASHDERHGAIVLVDAIASDGLQTHDLAVVAELCPNAVIVNAGLPAPHALPLAVIDCFGASRLAAEGALAHLLEATAD